MIQDLILSMIRLSVPLIFASFGGLLSERSGVANIALESYLLFSAFAAASVVSLTGSLWLGVAAGLIAAGLAGAVFAWVCIWGRGDQIVVGTGMNLLAAGLIPVMCKSLFGVTGSTPSLDLQMRFSRPEIFFLLGLIVLGFLIFLFRSTRHGLRITAAGENPLALSSQGVPYRLVRLRAVIEGALLAGIGGIYLSLCQSSGFVRDMSAGRGFIALAALIFGGWRPLPTLLACLFFAFADALQIQLQNQSVFGILIPHEFVQVVPYVATLVILVAYSRKMRAPAMINQDLV